MSSGARVGSIAALESFRSSLVLYLTRSRTVLEDVAQETVRMRIWLETDRQVHWKRQIRLASTTAAQADQELVTARLSGDAGAILDRKKALAKAREALRQTEDKLERVRRWLQRYPTDVEARGALPQRLQQVLAGDGSRAVNFLETAATILSDYADRGSGSAGGPGGPVGTPVSGIPGGPTPTERGSPGTPNVRRPGPNVGPRTSRGEPSALSSQGGTAQDHGPPRFTGGPLFLSELFSDHEPGRRSSARAQPQPPRSSRPPHEPGDMVRAEGRAPSGRRPMSAGGNAARLANLTRELLQRWQQTREVWADGKAREFEDRFVRELESQLNATLPAIEQLESILQQVRHDCE